MLPSIDSNFSGLVQIISVKFIRTTNELQCFSKLFLQLLHIVLVFNDLLSYRRILICVQLDFTLFITICVLDYQFICLLLVFSKLWVCIWVIHSSSNILIVLFKRLNGLQCCVCQFSINAIPTNVLIQNFKVLLDFQLGKLNLLFYNVVLNHFIFPF